jgi:signal transduction histidine kinase
MAPDYPHKVVPESLSASDPGKEPINNEKNIEAVRKATHEIAGSFFSISSAAVMLKMSLEKEEDITVIVEHLVEACQDFKYRLGNLLEYTKCHAGLLDARLDTVRCRPFISRMAAECLAFAGEYGVGIDTRLTDAVPETIVLDEYRLAIVINNLLKSAITLTPAGGQVLLAIGSDTRESITLFLSNTEKVPGAPTPESWLAPEQPEEPSGRTHRMDLTVTQYLVEQIFGGKLVFKTRQAFGPIAEVSLPTNLHLLDNH